MENITRIQNIFKPFKIKYIRKSVNEPFQAEVNRAQEMLETTDLQQELDLLVPGYEHSKLHAATAGTVESKSHSAINPFAGENSWKRTRMRS